MKIYIIDLEEFLNKYKEERGITVATMHILYVLSEWYRKQSKLIEPILEKNERENEIRDTGTL